MSYNPFGNSGHDHSDLYARISALEKKIVGLENQSKNHSTVLPAAVRLTADTAECNICERIMVKQDKDVFECPKCGRRYFFMETLRIF